ncbi:MAG: diaminopimelate epimerase [Candidatus Kapabacteria bacterium]|nr:diaminopimelate epimerase [Candidatus Kapabacteria bacterium]
MNLKIYNMSGAGNLFNVIDNRDYALSREIMAQLVPEIVKLTQTENFLSEGVMFLNNSIEYDFVVNFYNTDGTSGMMCGNGGRCAVRFAKDLNFVDETQVSFFMAGSNYKARFNAENIILSMPDPIKINTDFEYEFDGEIIKCGLFDVGSDHFVVRDSDLGIEFDDDAKFIEIARKIRYDFSAFPRGVNVNLISIADNCLKIKTYERGIERITGACGTGSVSAAIYAHIHDNLPLPIKLIPPSGSELYVNFVRSSTGNISEVTLEGAAVFLDERKITI